MPDLETVLRAAKTSDTVRADAWDIVSKASSSDELAANLRKLPLTDRVRADLWDVRFGAKPEAPPEPGFLDNVRRNAGEVYEGMKQTVLHPIETALALDAEKKRIGQAPPQQPMTVDELARDFKAGGGFTGGAKRFASGVYEHPVEAALVVAPLLPKAVGGLRVKLGDIAAANAAKATAKQATRTGKLARSVFPDLKPESWSRGSKLVASHAKAPIQTADDLVAAADTAISTLEGRIKPVVQQYATSAITTNPLDDVRAAFKGHVDATFLPAAEKELARFGLDKPVTLERAEAIRQHLNAENEVALAQNGYKRAALRKTNPAFAAREKAAESLRDGIYDRLEQVGFPEARSIRRDVGAAIELRNAALKAAKRPEAKVGGTATNSVLRRAAATGVRMTPAPAILSDPIAALIKPSNLTRDAAVAELFRSH